MVQLRKVRVVAAVVVQGEAWKHQGKESGLVHKRTVVVGWAMGCSAAVRVNLDHDGLPAPRHINPKLGKPSVVNPVVRRCRGVLGVNDANDLVITRPPTEPVSDTLPPPSTTLAQAG